MAMKHTLIAGIAALALLIAPITLTAQWSDHGPAIISTASAVSTAHAASSRPTPTKAPSTGGPATTTSGGGNVSKVRGFHPSLLVDQMNDYCQAMADIWDSTIDLAQYYNSIGNDVKFSEMAQRAGAIESDAQSHGCVFIIE